MNLAFLNETLELKVDGVPKLDEHCRRALRQSRRLCCAEARLSVFSWREESPLCSAEIYLRWQPAKAKAK